MSRDKELTQKELRDIAWSAGCVGCEHEPENKGVGFYEPEKTHFYIEQVDGGGVSRRFYIDREFKKIVEGVRKYLAVAEFSFQSRVKPWLLETFGKTIASDKVERNHRFLEEALELVQATGCTQDEAHKLVDYVFSRPVGELKQEVGGTMVTLAALCLANSVDMHDEAETELARVWTKVEQIREKQKSKPQFSPLPGVYKERIKE